MQLEFLEPGTYHAYVEFTRFERKKRNVPTKIVCIVEDIFYPTQLGDHAATKVMHTLWPSNFASQPPTQFRDHLSLRSRNIATRAH